MKKLNIVEMDQPSTVCIDHFPSLSHANRRLLNRLVSLLEVCLSVFQMSTHKAPGLNGLVPIFFQKYWDTSQIPVWKFLHAAFTDGRFPEQLNYTLIALVMNNRPLK